MPARLSVTVQVYVATFDEGVGPVFAPQLAPEGLPVNAQVPIPDGAVAPLGPVTVAVNISLVPKA